MNNMVEYKGRYLHRNSQGFELFQIAQKSGKSEDWDKLNRLIYEVDKKAKSLVETGHYK